jgi:phospholipid transport system transporter-binding protein
MIERQGDRCLVSGNVTHDQVPALLEQSDALLDHGCLVIDLAGVQAVDSSILSLLLEWMRRAAGRNTKLTFANPVPALRSLIDLYGLSDVIPLTPR